jgi:cytidine deaminase
VLAEFAPELEIVSITPEHEQQWRLSALLPHAFTRDDLSGR